MNRAVAMRIAACGLIGLGAALLIASLLLTTYTAGRISKVPLDIDTTLISEGTGTAVDPSSLARDRFQVDRDVALVQQQQITTEAPSDAEVVTLQVGTTLRRGDQQQDAGLLTAVVDTVTIDRTTAEAVSDEANPAGAVQKPRTIEGESPAIDVALPHEGLAYRFPFDTQKQTYAVFDPIAQDAYSANYVGEETVNGLTTYRFTQNVGYDNEGRVTDPIRYASLYDNEEDSTVTAPALLWGIEGDPEESITMTRFYAAQRDFWVDPVSGTIVKTQERSTQFFARDPAVPEVTFVDYTVVSTEQTVEQQVAAAGDERDRIAVWSRILPITFTAAGLIMLVGGALAGLFSLRAEATLIDPGLDTAGHGFFGSRGATEQAPSGFEAETEKIPAQRPPSRAAGPDADAPRDPPR